MEKIMSNWKKYDMTLNQQVKEIIATAKIDVLKAMGMTDKKQKSNDYATKISNAIQFMKMTLDDVDADAVDNAVAATLDVEIYAICTFRHFIIFLERGHRHSRKDRLGVLYVLEI